ncbi:MAG: hypothetical protein RIR91_820 [Verrucomicrobiota bacterium]
MSQDKPVRSVNLTLLPSLAFLVFGVALALAFVIASDKVGKSIGQFKQNRPEIIVKGVATLDVRSGQVPKAAPPCSRSARRCRSS